MKKDKKYLLAFWCFLFLDIPDDNDKMQQISNTKYIIEPNRK